MNKKNIKIAKQAHLLTFKGYASSYNVEILIFFYPELQLKDTESPIKKEFKKLLSGLRGFKFPTTLVLVLKKIRYETFYSYSKAETIINESYIDDNVFKSIYSISNSYIKHTKNLLGKGSGWITDSVREYNINISKYNPLACSSYIILPKELDHPKKGLINIQNINGNECFINIMNCRSSPSKN